ncbi:MAG: type I glyceraldehyde-3-phosphate dehydrogenase [Candidatus Paceibacterota bacterium]
MVKKIAINGFGRIGRNTLKIILGNEMDCLDVVAINDLTDAKTLAHLLQYDTAYGIYEEEIIPGKDSLIIGGKTIKLFAEKDPLNLPWKELGVDIVLECTGVFTDKEGAQKHITAGAKKVIISAPAKSEDIPSFVLGINENKYKGEAIFDMGSCTTNCLAPVIKVLEEEFGIVKGFMTTVHSYTNDQRILDLPHKDLRRARAAAENIIPTTTGAARAISKVIPEVKGKLDGMSLRVPTPVGSIIDVVCELKKKTTVEELNKIFIKRANKKELQGIMWAEDAPLVSSDYIGNPFSSIVDLPLTMVNGNMVKVFAWYDNEWGYSTRLAEMAEYIAHRDK